MKPINMIKPNVFTELICSVNPQTYFQVLRQCSELCVQSVYNNYSKIRETPDIESSQFLLLHFRAWALHKVRPVDSCSSHCLDLCPSLSDYFILSFSSSSLSVLHFYVVLRDSKSLFVSLLQMTPSSMYDTPDIQYYNMLGTMYTQ